jgi:hypothetical protein
MKSFSFVLITLLICGCKQKQMNKEYPQNEQYTKVDSSKKLSVERIGELRFRKSYALDETIPSYCYDENADSLLLKRFKALGYLNNDYDLLEKKLSSFKLFNFEKPDTTFNLIDDLNKKISCQIKKSDSSFIYDLSVADSVQKVVNRINNKFILPGLQFRTANMIPGGFEEVILLDAYYIINGDNFDFFIYEIKYN